MTTQHTLGDRARAATTHGLVEQSARTRPDTVALRGPDASLTYGQLDTRADGLARALADAGAGPGVPVALTVPRSCAHVVATLAIWKQGGICVPVDPLLPARRAERLMALSGARITVGPGLEVSTTPAPGAPHTWAAGSAPADRIAYVFFTSGSSGEPKAVAIPHSGIVNEALWTAGTYGFGPGTVGSWLSSPGFAITRWELWSPLTAGACVAVADEGTEWDAPAVQRWLCENGVTWSVVVTGLGERLMALAWPGETALRVLITGGEQLRSWPEGLPFEVVNSYGVTETSGVRLVAPLNPLDAPGARPEGLPPIGAPIRETSAYVLDADLRPVPEGETGELYIGGTGLAHGYLGRPGLTAEHFVPDPFRGAGHRMYRTGDLVRRTADGSLGYVGRGDGESKARGVRLNPAEVESALLAHPAVTAAAVLVRPDGVTGYVVRREGAGLHAHELRAFLAGRLHAAAVPTVLVELPALPVLLSGKTDRNALPRPTADSTLTDRHAPPLGPVEETVAEAFAAILDVRRVGRDDDFFALGGDSLGVARLKARLERTYAVPAPAATLFEERTPRRIATALFPHDGPPPPRPPAERATGPETAGSRADWVATLSDDEVEDLLAVMDRMEER
ncbi:non-ribosomal peptide synthetase [Streptomyces sp. NPDC032940]|uniref:non-ribosomal peptide synthetase n=1 Tax=Streptomyces sp. NPDC032940 TaxID=3155366 RepID=UPI0033CE1C53